MYSSVALRGCSVSVVEKASLRSVNGSAELVYFTTEFTEERLRATEDDNYLGKRRVPRSNLCGAMS